MSESRHSKDEPRTRNGEKQKKKPITNGLFNKRKQFEDEEPTAEEEDGPDEERKKTKDELVTNQQCNILLGALNVTFAIALIAYLGSSNDLNYQMIVALLIGLLSLVVCTAALVFFSLCHMPPQKFHEALELHVEGKRKTDPEFHRKLEGVWWVSRKKWMESKEAVDEELLGESGRMIDFKGFDVEEEADEIDDGELPVDDGELRDKPEPEPANDKRLPITDTKDGREYATTRVEMTEIESKSRAPGNDEKKRVPAVNTHEKTSKTGGRKVEDVDEPMTPTRSILASKRKENKRRTHNKSVTWDNDNFGTGEEFEILGSLEEDNIGRSDDLYPASDDSDVTEDVNFYDELFKARSLPLSFREWKQPLMDAYPDGTDLVHLDEAALATIIPNSRPKRTRIVNAAKKLYKTLQEEAEQHRKDQRYGNDFLIGPPDSDDEDDNLQLNHE